MVLFLSDLHFGKGTRAEEAALERDLLAFLSAHAEAVEALYLVGDVYDAYIEYRHLMPKGPVRLLGLLAAWADRGTPITYLVGNHDPWHRDFFSADLGIRLRTDPFTEAIHGQHVHLAHGDGLASNSRLYARLKPLLRHPVPVALYRTLLPGDMGMGLALWWKTRFGNVDIQPATVAGLRAYARHVLGTTEATAVLMGHSHYAEQQTWPEGTYLNLGSWRDHRTFATLDGDGFRLLHWNGTCSTPWHPTPLP